jgi:hypothetical protein
MISAFNPNQIRIIGEMMVKCDLQCHGISNIPEEGKIPRCMYIDNETRDPKKGCIIVGINPGISKKENTENQKYIKEGVSYKAISEHWQNMGKQHPYYSKLNNLVYSAGYTGPIFWTELVKCESAIRNKIPPLSTMRKCVNKYLLDEIKNTPSDWPLFAIGKEVYKALGYLYPDRTIIGVPHSTGSFGHFNRLMRNKEINENIYNQIQQLKQGDIIWLEVKKEMSKDA